jgi:hypothetical protein
MSKSVNGYWKRCAVGLSVGAVLIAGTLATAAERPAKKPATTQPGNRRPVAAPAPASTQPRTRGQNPAPAAAQPNPRGQAKTPAANPARPNARKPGAAPATVRKPGTTRTPNPANPGNVRKPAAGGTPNPRGVKPAVPGAAPTATTPTVKPPRK